MDKFREAIDRHIEAEDPRLQDEDCCEYCGEPSSHLIKTKIKIGDREFYEYYCEDCAKEIGGFKMKDKEDHECNEQYETSTEGDDQMEAKIEPIDIKKEMPKTRIGKWQKFVKKVAEEIEKKGAVKITFKDLDSLDKSNCGLYKYCKKNKWNRLYDREDLVLFISKKEWEENKNEKK